jgi:hypothetical protein
MSELHKKEPELVSILDPTTWRSLLDDPHPIEVDTSSGTAMVFHLVVVNGPEAPIELHVTADQGWLQPQTHRLLLAADEKGSVEVIAQPDQGAEFANLCLSWQSSIDTCSEYVLVWNKGKPARVAHSSGVSQLPAWMREEN